MGPEEIVYGDKVINIRNHRRKRVWPVDGAAAYIANGEIGTLVITKDNEAGGISSQDIESIIREVVLS